jgi:hypothetical protein
MGDTKFSIDNQSKEFSDELLIKPKRIASLQTQSMEITLPKSSGISLKIAPDATRGNDYPTARLQKGLLLTHNGLDLSEEGVGFGVPLLKRGIKILYPGNIELVSSRNGTLEQVTAKFTLNLEEKVILPGFKSAQSNRLYPVKYLLAAIIRRWAPLRGFLTTLSNALRWMFGLKTVFEIAEFSSSLIMIYTIDRQAGALIVEVDTKNLSGNGITEVFVLNEQGARYFNVYRDSSGTLLRGEAIGCWDKVTAEQASFLSETHRLAFTLHQVKGATLYRGRELIGSRLAWSGFGYSFQPTIERFSYQVSIESLQ